MKYVIALIVLTVFVLLFDRAMKADMENICRNTSAPIEGCV